MARKKKRALAPARRSAQRPTVTQRSGVPHEVQDFLDRLSAKGKTALTASGHAVKTFKALQSDAVASADVTDVVFDIDAATTAKLVRVYLQGKGPGEPDIVNSANPHGVLAGQVVGTFITIVIEVAGDPDSIGVVDVQHATPGSIKLKVSDGPVGTKPLFVTG